MTHLCDLHSGRLEKAWSSLSELQDRKPTMVKNMRRVLEAGAVDAVASATPDHWHALATVLSCQVGKNWCVEKPHSHNI